MVSQSLWSESLVCRGGLLFSVLLIVMSIEPLSLKLPLLDSVEGSRLTMSSLLDIQGSLKPFNTSNDGMWRVLGSMRSSIKTDVQVF